MRNSKVINGNKIAIVRPELLINDDDSMILNFELQVPRNKFNLSVDISSNESIDIINQDSFADAYDYLDQFMRQSEIDKAMDFIDSTIEKLIRKIKESSQWT